MWLTHHAIYKKLSRRELWLENKVTIGEIIALKLAHALTENTCEKLCADLSYILALNTYIAFVCGCALFTRCDCTSMLFIYSLGGGQNRRKLNNKNNNKPHFFVGGFRCIASDRRFSRVFIWQNLSPKNRFRTCKTVLLFVGQRSHQQQQLFTN